MTTTFKNMGDMMSLLIDRPTLEKLGIDEQTPILVTTDENGIHLQPIRFAPSEEVERVAIQLMETHAETLTRLSE
jgi:hypothetical protein